MCVVLKKLRPNYLQSAHQNKKVFVWYKVKWVETKSRENDTNL